VRSLLWALGLGMVGCRTEHSLPEGESTAHICWAEERLRSVSNSEKASYLADLKSSGCMKGSDTCVVRDRCVAAYTLHVDGLKLTAAAKQQLNDGDGEAAARLLGSAQEKLERARGEVDDCTARTAALRRRYGL
jgi:hypothetical protein